MRYLYIILTLFVLVSCEEQDIIFEGPYHVRFTETSQTLKESFSGEIELSVHLVAPQWNDDILINYSIGGDAREGFDYEILSERGFVEIEEGESFGYIRLRLLNNSNNILESQDIVFTLESVSDASLDIGFGPGVKAGKEFVFTILDDCILGGTYTGTNVPGQPPVQDITITSTDCIEYVLSNYDVHVFTFPGIRPLVFKDNGDNTITIPEQEDATLSSSQATIRGNGVVDPITREIILSIEFVDFDGSPIVNINLTPN